MYLTWVSPEPADPLSPVQRASSRPLLGSVIQVQLPLCPVRIATKKENVSQYVDIHDEYQGQNADRVNQLSITFSFYGVISRNYFIALEILVYYDLTSVSVQFKAILI